MQLFPAVFRQKSPLHAVENDAADFIPGQAEAGVRELIFTGQGDAENLGIIGVEGDNQSLTQEEGERMGVEIGDDVEPEIAAQALGERDLFLPEAVDQKGVLDGAGAVVDAFGVEQIEGVANAIGAESLTCVHGAVETSLPGQIEGAAVIPLGIAAFITGEADSGDQGMIESGDALDQLGGLLGTM